MKPIEKDDGKTEYLTSSGADVVIGGSPVKFVPNINASKWQDECWLNINHKDTIVGEEVESYVNGKIDLKVDKAKHEYYIDENGDLEYSIIYDEEPSKIELELDYPDGLQFHYQGELTEQEIADGAHRDERVVGSYAVYWTKSEGKYQTGKFCHIYRPELIDAEGTRRWASMEIKNKKITITADFDGLVFPVIVDPTFGYTSVGASSNDLPANGGFGIHATGAAGTGNKLVVHINNINAAARNTKGALYTYDSLTAGTYLTNGITSQVALAGSADFAWVDYAFASAPTLTAVEYWLCIFNALTGTNVHYDTVADGGGTISTAYADLPPATFTITDGNRKYSIYCDYSEPAGTGNPWYYYANQ